MNSASACSDNCDTTTDAKELSTMEEQEKNAVSVYSNPILLPPDFPVTQESCGFISTTITLNMAIANHLYGLELQQQHAPLQLVQQHLAGAGRYYEYTIRLERARQQEEQSRILESTASGGAVSSTLAFPLFVSILALLVILNNLGQLHMALSNTHQSLKCFRQLQSALLFLLLHKTNHPSSIATKSKDLAVFMENATIGLGTKTSRFTAAAA
jgi:hypothetical protein